MRTYFEEMPRTISTKEANQERLKRVLLAFARYNQKDSIGYVQGMNFIAAALLHHCNEVITFWLMVSLMENYGLRSVYAPGLPGLKI